MKPKLLFDPAQALTHLQVADPLLGALIRRVGPFTLKPHPVKSLFEALLRSIVYQQIHGKAAAAILGRVRARLTAAGGVKPASVVRTSDGDLRSAGLSAAKLASIRDLATKCLAGTVPTMAVARRLPDDDLQERLTSVRGIGPWTVHMFLLFHLGRGDVLPTGDFAIRLAFQKLYRKRRNPSPAVIQRQARHWQPYRSVASWYLWRSLDTP